MDSNTLKLALRSWPEDTSDANSLAILIGRIQHERGFREITEETLQGEISSGKDSSQQTEDVANGGDDDQQEGGEEEEAEKEGDVAANRASEIAKAKEEMGALVAHALNESLIALDYISLLVSLNSPDAGSSTMSPALKSSVPVGSLGVDRITRKPEPQAIQDDITVSRAWKMEGLNSAADALLGASKKLGEEVGKEIKYWDQVLSIQSEGWLVTRMPRERQTLGVRYGFAEAATEYKNKGIGALRRGEDGSIAMEDVDTSGSHGKAMLRVRVTKDGEIVGMSIQNRQCESKGTGTLKDVIERARNFVYEDELFFEIMREARVLASHGVRTTEEGAVIELDDGTSIIIDMAPLDDEDSSIETSTTHESSLAQGIAIALRILLSYNHRCNLKKRSSPPPPLTQQKPPSPPLYLVRPIITHLAHSQHLTFLQNFLKHIITTANSAGLQASYTLKPLQNCLKTKIKDVESAVETFLEALESQAMLTLPGGWGVGIVMKTTLSKPLYGTGYIVNTAHDGVAARPMGENIFASREEMEMYLLWCLERAVVNAVRTLGEGERWEQLALSNEMQKVGLDKRTRRVRFEVGRDGLKMIWGRASGKDEIFVWDGGDKGKTLQELLKAI